VTSGKVMLDTNAVLRFITNDDGEKSEAVADLLSAADCAVPVEVIAEAVYVLEKRYNHPRRLVAEAIKDFAGIKDGLVLHEKAVRCGCGCDAYASSRLDFVDCLLVGYADACGCSVFTFDGNLRKRLGRKAHG